MFQFRVFALFALGFLLGVVLLGCGETAPPSDAQQPANDATAESDEVHIHSDDIERPVDYASALQRIKSYRDTIRDEIAAGRTGKAHRPLDEAMFVLEWLPEITQESNIPKDKWESVNMSAQKIRSLLDQVHERIDKKQNPDFDSVSEDIGRAIESLESVQQSTDSGSKEASDQEADAGDKGDDQ